MRGWGQAPDRVRSWTPGGSWAVASRLPALDQPDVLHALPGVAVGSGVTRQHAARLVARRVVLVAQPAHELIADHREVGRAALEQRRRDLDHVGAAHDRL